MRTPAQRFLLSRFPRDPEKKSAAEKRNKYIFLDFVHPLRLATVRHNGVDVTYLTLTYLFARRSTRACFCRFFVRRNWYRFAACCRFLMQEDGFLFDGMRLSEGAAFLVRLRDDRALCRRMGERGRKKVGWRAVHRGVVSHHVPSYRVVSCHIISCHVVSIISLNIILCRIIWYNHIISYRIVSFHV